jgi:DNA-binding response OmpR family regulator
MVSGRTDDSDVDAGRATGVDIYLAKPFAANELRTCVRELLDQAMSAPAASDPPSPCYRSRRSRSCH